MGNVVASDLGDGVLFAGGGDAAAERGGEQRVRAGTAQAAGDAGPAAGPGQPAPVSASQGNRQERSRNGVVEPQRGETSSLSTTRNG